MALQGYDGGFMAIDAEDTVVAINKTAGEEHMLQIRSQTTRIVNVSKDDPTEEQGDLKQVEINYV